MLAPPDLETVFMPATATVNVSAAQSGTLPAAEPLANRELSWLDFNRRVLNESMDARTPLLERVGFLKIFASNLDEFFMKRVGAFKRQQQAAVISTTPDGLSPAQQLAAIRLAVLPQLQIQSECFANSIFPALAEN